MQNISKNKKGYITISQSCQNQHDMMFVLFSVFIPLAITPREKLNGTIEFEYYGLCEQFEETDVLHPAPEYDLIFEIDNKNQVSIKSITKKFNMNIRSFKFGKLKPKFDRRTLMFHNYLQTIPDAPAVYQWPDAPPMGMLLNNQIGDCTIAGALHMERLWSKANNIDFTPTDQQALQAYQAISGYQFGDPSTDVGCNMLDVLNYWRRTGIGGRKIGAFVQVNPLNHSHVQHASFFFGGLFVGFNLPLCAVHNPELGWDVPRTGLVGDGVPGSAGGHAVSLCGYSQTTVDLCTWGMRIPATWEFWDTYIEECWAIISPDFMLNSDRAPNGFSMAQLQADLQLVAN